MCHPLGPVHKTVDLHTVQKPHKTENSHSNHNQTVSTGEVSEFQFLTLDPNKAIQEIEFPPSVGARAPVGPPDFIGLLC